MSSVIANQRVLCGHEIRLERKWKGALQIETHLQKNKIFVIEPFQVSYHQI